LDSNNSPCTARFIAMRQLGRPYITTCCSPPTAVKCLLCLLDLTVTAAFDTVDQALLLVFYFVWSDSLVFAVLCCAGSSRTCLTDHFVWSISTRRHPLFALCALYPRGKYSVHDSSSCIRQTLPKKYSSTV